MFTADKSSSNSNTIHCRCDPYVIQIKMKNQVDPTQFIITNRVRCSTKYPGAPSVYSTPMAYARRFVGYNP